MKFHTLQVSGLQLSVSLIFVHPLRCGALHLGSILHILSNNLIAFSKLFFNNYEDLAMINRTCFVFIKCTSFYFPYRQNRRRFEIFSKPRLRAFIFNDLLWLHCYLY